MELMDANGDGDIDFGEFCLQMDPGRTQRVREEHTPQRGSGDYKIAIHRNPIWARYGLGICLWRSCCESFGELDMFVF